MPAQRSTGVTRMKVTVRSCWPRWARSRAPTRRTGTTPKSGMHRGGVYSLMEWDSLGPAHRSRLCKSALFSHFWSVVRSLELSALPSSVSGCAPLDSSSLSCAGEYSHSRPQANSCQEQGGGGLGQRSVIPCLQAWCTCIQHRTGSFAWPALLSRVDHQQSTVGALCATLPQAIK